MFESVLIGLQEFAGVQNFACELLWVKAKQKKEDKAHKFDWKEPYGQPWETITFRRAVHRRERAKVSGRLRAGKLSSQTPR